MKGKFTYGGNIDRWLLVSLALLVAGLIVGLGGLVGACSGTETTTTSTSTTSTTQATTSTTQAVNTTQAVTTSEAATTTTEETLQIQTDFGVPYVTRAEKLGPAVINVWAPKKPGPWPVVVMVHGGAKPMMPGGTLPLQPMKVAQRGAVVFAPVWWRDVGPSPNTVADATDAKEFRAVFLEQISEIAAAVRFARANAARYGGNPDNVTLFGFSGGATMTVRWPWAALLLPRELSQAQARPSRSRS